MSLSLSLLSRVFSCAMDAGMGGPSSDSHSGVSNVLWEAVGSWWIWWESTLEGWDEDYADLCWFVLVDINRQVHQNISRACASCWNSEHGGRPNSEGAGEVGTENWLTFWPLNLPWRILGTNGRSWEGSAVEPIDSSIRTLMRDHRIENT